MSTICAIATPPGGALGVVRVSGPEAIRATQAVFVPQGKKTLKEKAGNSLTFGRIVDPTTHEVVDEVLVSLFRAPHSYTGEDSTEISCHGSAYILQRVVELLLQQGCQMARPGEYTQRAFLNGKMDLSQAEAVADLIASTTQANHRMAMNQMRGGFSRELRALRDKLLHITALLELELDFSDHEDLEFADRTELLSLARTIDGHIARLCASFRLGNVLKRGMPVAIVGETNAGKSTLLNALVGEERALVSDIHGTTRDTVEETVVVGNTLLRFIDTAGIRATQDTVERMGIERTFAKIHEAEMVLWLIDATRWEEQWRELHHRILTRCDGTASLWLLFNKTDLLTPQELEALKRDSADRIAQVFSAAATGTPASGAEVGGAVPVFSAAATGAPASGAEVGDAVPENHVSADGVAACVSEDSDTVDTVEGSASASGASVPVVFFSAHSAADIDRLRHLLSEHVERLSHAADPSHVIVSNLRHYEALSAAGESIRRVISGLHDNLSGDFVSQDLRECIHHLSDIIGEVTPESVLHSIFREFCIGK